MFDSALTQMKLAGLALFNTQILNRSLYVAYANRTATGTSGLVAQFDLNGNFIKVVAAGGTPNQPWDLDNAPASFVHSSKDLLIGNLADDLISVFDPGTGAFLGLLDGPPG